MWQNDYDSNFAGQTKKTSFDINSLTKNFLIFSLLHIKTQTLESLQSIVGLGNGRLLQNLLQSLRILTGDRSLGEVHIERDI